MISRYEVLSLDVDQASAWPYTYATQPRSAHTQGPWDLLMDASGSIVVWSRKTDSRAPEGYIKFARAATKAQAMSFVTMFCSLGHETDAQLVYQTGRIYFFNWISGTLSQVYVASQIAKLFFEGDVDGAWDYGRAFEKKVEEGMAKLRVQV
jgi:hypothetical protein